MHVHEADGPWFFEGPGLTNALARGIDWDHGILGPWQGWPTSLKTTLAMVFRASQPMFVWWGAELVQFYNDAYLPSFGRGKHPAAMGQRGRECWQEIWPIIGPQIAGVMTRGEATWNEDHLVPIERNGRIEEVYWTYSYGPLFTDDGEIGGTLVVCTETTARVIAERRMRMLRALADRTALAVDQDTMMMRAAEAMALFPADIPFALLYADERTTGQLRLAGHVGCSAEVAQAMAPALAEVMLAAVAGDATPRELAFDALTAHVPTGRWPAQLEQVWAAPIVDPVGRAACLLVLGVSGRLTFAEAYRQFFGQILEHLAVARTRIAADLARIATEQQRDSLLTHAPVATALLMGPQHVFDLANPPYRQMVGGRELVGRSYVEAFPELVDTPLPGILDHVYTTGEPYVTAELRIPLDFGGGLVERWFRFNLEPLRDHGGLVYGMMAVALDITEQVVARRVLERAGDEREKLLGALEAANRTKDEFLAMLGHELRNPLSPIVTALQILKLHRAGAPSREHEIIERQVKHLVRLVDDLLDVARITRGHLELRKEAVDLRDVVAKGIEMASPLLETRRHRLALTIADERLMCDGDAVRLAQVVANLLTNAARYTEPGGHIALYAGRTGAHVEVRVADDGVGIPADMLPQMFEMFVQGKRGTDRNDGGLGIGLALVKNLVALHGGTITASSAGTGQGSVFVVQLPAADAAASGPHPVVTPPPTGHGRRVLVVDDNVDAAEMLGDMLTMSGHTVALAHDGLSALAVFAQFAPEVAILDIGLPVRDGYELATEILADPANAGCRLIALTGYGQANDRRRSSAAGFSAHLVKPIDLNSILALVEAGPR